MGPSWQQANLKSWNQRAALHVRDATGFYGVDGFLAGRDTLGPIEASEIGDVAGRSLLHLQCHLGLDTLSLARRGATVTGLDFSPVAVDEARSLAARAGLPATFVQADLYEAREALEGAFDMVYSSWGTICWLPDIRAWARVVADMLAPGGTFYFADSHPFALVLDERDGVIRPTYGWRTPKDRPDAFTDAQSYTGDVFAEPVTDYNWIHPPVGHRHRPDRGRPDPGIPARTRASALEAVSEHGSGRRTHVPPARRRRADAAGVFAQGGEAGVSLP
jgi:SAM-dependent methyltransferase